MHVAVVAGEPSHAVPAAAWARATAMVVINVHGSAACVSSCANGTTTLLEPQELVDESSGHVVLAEADALIGDCTSNVDRSQPSPPPMLHVVGSAQSLRERKPFGRPTAGPAVPARFAAPHSSPRSNSSIDVPSDQRGSRTGVTRPSVGIGDSTGLVEGYQTASVRKRGAPQHGWECRCGQQQR